ncbi:hypothetical protein LTR84_001835 [Exophiala bonariae]|uniref:GST N-terminal domain-containing protein n=1 Tax=Exophiala bonariae TaxID=1690606 RepID=A0AAV9NCU0_9EURO|nr:hypothetical protein LTR84_001835 [Exophiala bonariae]
MADRKPPIARMVLNYKGIDYRTVWVEYPDIEPLMKPHLPPNNDDKFISYTCPTIQLPDGEWIKDSLKIVKRLEQLYPQKPLGLACDPYLEEVLELTEKTIKTIMPDFAPKVAKKILDEASQEFFQRTRKALFGGRTLDEVSAELGGTQAYGKAAPLVERVTELLNKDSAGPYFQGNTVSYADFVWTALLAFLETLGDGSLELLIGADKSSHLAMLEACRPWLARDSH